MDENLKDILSNTNKDIDNQKLMDYISGKLPKEQVYEVEKEMADSEFMNDAVEGLENFTEKKNIQSYVDELNRNLHKSLDKKKQRKEKRKLREYPWITFAIILLLVLMVISFIVIKKHLDNTPAQQGIEQKQ